MARVRLRLFAAAREAAGRAEAELDATTVGELLDTARSDFGPDFAAVLMRARVWVNGDEPVGATPRRSRTATRSRSCHPSAAVPR